MGIARCILFAVATLALAYATNLSDELKINYEQKAAIDKLRQRVLPYITDPYMKQDLSLLRWLRATNFNVDEAQKRIIANIKWRKDNRIDNILSEDFSDMEADYPTIFTVDKQGQPTFIGFAGEWDVRASTLTGNGQRIVRYINRSLEQGVRMIRDLQYQGKNITRLNLLIDLDGWNMAQHGCVNCLLRTLDFVFLYDNNYPSTADRVLFLNSPVTVAASAELLRTNVNPETWKVMKFYGKDKNVLRQKLLEFIDEDKLPQQLGGTMDISKLK